MAFCTACGNEIDDKASVCLKCGVPTEKYPNPVQSTEDETLLTVLGTLGVFFLTIFIPVFGVVLGVVLGIVFWNSKPKAAKAIIITTIVTFIFYLIILMSIFLLPY